MSTRTNVALHGNDLNTRIQTDVYEGQTGTFACLTVGDEQHIDLYTYDPIFLRRLANSSSALAHELEQQLMDTQVPA